MSMARYKVYDSNGSTERCTLDKVEYSGSFMDRRVVNATVDTPVPLAFDVGDYITYRGERFELDYQPSATKNSSSGNQSDSFRYNLQFVSCKYELERCMMRDIVPGDNGIVYPTPLSIEFTGTASKLAERIQSCLDLMYTGSRKWTITVAPGVDKEEKNITISQSNCWSALSLFNTEYGLNFYVSGREVSVGGEQLAVDYNFRYGMGNGLYKIERSPDTDTAIVTRLIAYGGTQNIPDNYLKDKKQWKDSILPASMYLPNLMLPGFEKTKKDYIDSPNAGIYGIREGVVVFEDIYPSLAGMTNSKGERIDKIRSAETVSSGSQDTFWITTYDLEFELTLAEYFLATDTPRVYIKTGQLQGYNFEIVQEKVEKQGDGSYKIYLRRNSNEGFPFPNEDVNITAGTEFVFLGISMPKSYMDAASERLRARALEYLAKYGATSFTYNIYIDELFMSRMPDIYNSLYEGRKLHVSDADMGIDENITIQSLSITEELAGLPQIKVTLNNTVSATTLNRIQGQVSQLESQVANSFTSLKWLTEQKLAKFGKPTALWDSSGAIRWLMLNDTEDMARLKYTLASAYDIIANSTGDVPEEGLPVASDYTTTGLFRAKQGGGLLYDTNTNGWYVNPDFAGGGGVNFTVGKGLQMSVDNELSVKYGTIAGTACQGDDSRLSNDRKNPYKLSWSGGEYDGSAEKTLPNFATVATLSNYVKKAGDDMSGPLLMTLTRLGSTYKIYIGANTSGEKNPYISIFGNTYAKLHVNQGSSDTSKWTDYGSTTTICSGDYLIRTSNTASNDFKFTGKNFTAPGDVVANSTTTAFTGVVPVADNATYGLVKYDNLTIKKNSSGQLYCTVQGGGSSGVVKYWRPSVNTSGVLSWALSESESTPSSVNIKGPKGDPGATGEKGQGVTYQWSGTQLRLGTINSSGNVSWGSYVDLKGPKGDPGSGGGSSTFTLESATFNSEIIWRCPSNSYGIRIRRTGGYTETRISGNIIDGRSGSSYTIGNLFFNYVAGNTNVRIDNKGRIYSNGSQVTSDLRLKTIEGNEEDVLDRMMQIPVIKFRRNDIKGAEQTTGFGAQSFIGVFDNIAFINEDSGYYGIREFAITAIAFQGCKELYAKYKAQQQTIDDLQSKLALLMQEIEKMKGGAV